jgi:hypothetical protein
MTARRAHVDGAQHTHHGDTEKIKKTARDER